MNVICDFDGTLCDTSHRLHLIQQEPPDWNAFFLAAKDDPPNYPIIELVCSLHNQGHDIWVFSGRGRIAEAVSRDWLFRFCVPFQELYMRPEGDYTPDQELKERWVAQYGFSPTNTLCVLDDRNKVVQMWRRLGFTCLQVAEGDF